LLRREIETWPSGAGGEPLCVVGVNLHKACIAARMLLHLNNPPFPFHQNPKEPSISPKRSA
jgi:hypothetical protein